MACEHCLAGLHRVRQHDFSSASTRSSSFFAASPSAASACGGREIKQIVMKESANAAVTKTARLLMFRLMLTFYRAVGGQQESGRSPADSAANTARERRRTD